MRAPLLILSGLACVAVSPAAPAGAQTTVGPPVTLPDSASAPAPGTPYPSPVSAAGEGIVTDVNVRISNLSHDFPDDADILLTGPGGQSTLLLSDAGASAPATSVDLAFDDEAAGPVTDPLVSGVYRPTDVTDPFPDLLPSPAPAAPFGSTLSVFDNTVGDGVWSLYVVDDDPGRRRPAHPLAGLDRQPVAEPGRAGAGGAHSHRGTWCRRNCDVRAVRRRRGRHHRLRARALRPRQPAPPARERTSSPRPALSRLRPARRRRPSPYRSPTTRASSSTSTST